MGLVTIKLTEQARQALRDERSIGVTYSQVILKLVAIRLEHLECPDPEPDLNPRRHREDGA